MPTIPAQQISSYEPCIAHTVEAAAKISTCGKTAIYAAIKSGELIARKAGRRTIILDADLRAWLANLPPINATAA